MLSKVEASFTFTFDGKRRIEPFDRTWTLSIAIVGIIWNSANIFFNIKQIANCNSMQTALFYIYMYTGFAFRLLKLVFLEPIVISAFFHTY